MPDSHMDVDDDEEEEKLSIATSRDRDLNGRLNGDRASETQEVAEGRIGVDLNEAAEVYRLLQSCRPQSEGKDST